MHEEKLIGFFLIIFILAVGMATASASENQTLTLADGQKTFTDIQNAIDNASENSTIELEGRYASQGKAIEIDKAITISSKNGTTLDAEFKSSIFRISNVNVCLKNLNLINSNSSTPAVSSQGNLTVMDCNFTNNTMIYPKSVTPFEDFERSASAIYSTDNLNIANCEFENNAAFILMWEHGDSGYAYCGEMVNSKRNLTITKSRFKDGYIESHGVLNISDSKFKTSPINAYSSATITRSAISNSEDFKSAVYAYSNINVIDCNFTANGGYAIFAESDSRHCKLTVKNCSFENNNLRSSGFYNAEYADFLSEFPVIQSEGHDIFVYDSKFINNTGNAINNHDGSTYVSDSFFTKNNAYTGGAIYSAKATVINSTFKSNRANFAGAINSESLKITNSTFSSNSEGAIKAGKVAVIDGITYKGQAYFDNSLKKIKIVTSTTQKLTTTYQSGKTISLKMIYTQSKKPLAKYETGVKIIKKKSAAYDYICTNSKGIAYLKASNLKVGTYKIIFNDDDYMGISPITTTIKITKAKTIIKAPKVTAKHKKSKYFKISIKNKATKKPVKNTYIKVKIDKKTYKVKTNSKGIAKINTKKLKIGKHKVTITSANANYQMSAKSTITIK